MPAGCSSGGRSKRTPSTAAPPPGPPGSWRRTSTHTRRRSRRQARARVARPSRATRCRSAAPRKTRGGRNRTETRSLIRAADAFGPDPRRKGAGCPAELRFQKTPGSRRRGRNEDDHQDHGEPRRTESPAGRSRHAQPRQAPAAGRPERHAENRDPAKEQPPRERAEASPAVADHRHDRATGIQPRTSSIAAAGIEGQPHARARQPARIRIRPMIGIAVNERPSRSELEGELGRADGSDPVQPSRQRGTLTRRE